MKEKYYLGTWVMMLFSVLIYSCATVPEKAEIEMPKEVEPPPAETKESPVPTKDETNSLELFTEILNLVESTNDRESVLPQIESLYEKIIRDYPNAPLAQESYWKLIEIYVDDYSPPAYGKAEAKYDEFKKKYPQSFFEGFIEDTLGNSYYKNTEWARLLKLSTPAYQEYRTEGKQPRPSMLFMYSEAQYNLGNINQAEEGYRIISELYPKLIVGIKSRKMLEEIEKQKSNP